MATRTVKRSSARPAAGSDIAETYDAFKEFEGQRYTDMKVGRSHKWYYDRGEWKEKKITPDQWEINYAVTKRRAGKAPEGSGVPVGTGYHWYILAHQNVTKLNANDYSTSLTGMKFKLAHKRADKDTWSASTQAQRRRLIKILQDVIKDLQGQAAADEKKPASSTSTPTPAKPTARKAVRPKKAKATKPTHRRAA